MAKQDKAARQDNPMITQSRNEGVVVAADFDDIEVARADEQISVEDILTALASPDADGRLEDPSEWRPAIIGSEYFWPAARGFVIRGFVVGVEERQTSLIVDGKPLRTRFYTFELTAPCVAIRSADVVPGQEMPRPVQCMPGQHVAVLERTILKRLEHSIGRETIVVCDGPAKTKRGLNLWKYRSWERRTVQKIEERALGDEGPRPALPPAS